MCGIHGLYQLDGAPAAAEWLTRMGNVTVHRGPDDAGGHVDGRCAIGMRRLSIIDLSGGHQPIANRDRVETVAPWLAGQALANDRNGARIAWLTRGKALWRFINPAYRKRRIVEEFEAAYSGRAR